MVKVLDREKIKRMTGAGSGVVGSSGGGDVDLSGYATQIWTTENFVSIEYFRTLFKAFDSNDDEIVPNNTTSVVNNIKAMVGLWTEQYLTALGNQSGGGGGGGGAQYLNDLLDVQLTTPLTDGQALVYNATLQKWVNGSAGVNMTTVWNALAGSTNEQINASHLSTALSGYVTTSDISDMATQTWVGQQGFATQTWVTSNFITIAYFDRLFRAYNGSTLVSHNDTTSTIDNIKAMFGFWTEFYLSALGTGGVSSVNIGLSQLNDVTLTSPTGGQALVYDALTNKWVNGTVAGVTSLSALTDVALTSPTTYQVLMYDATTTKWYNSALKTINGQPLYGSGDISVGGGASGNYLPLSGGTLTGNLTLPLLVNNWGFTLGNRYNHGAEINIGLYYTPDSIVNGYSFISNNSNVVPFSYSIFTSNWSNPTTLFSILGDGNVVINAFNRGDSGLLFRDGINEAQYIYNMSILSHQHYGHSYPDGLSINANGGVSICTGGNTRYQRFIVESNGYVGINLTTPEYMLDVAGDIMVRSSVDRYIKLYGYTSTWYLISFKSDGNFFGWYDTWSCFYFSQLVHIEGSLNVNGDIFSYGAVTALSDIRHKTVIKDAAIKVEDIAKMPAVMYQWNDGREDKELHVGSIAQSWQAVLPEVVLKANDEEGTLSMQYGVAALVSAIITARKVVNHEERIRQLEKENKELKERLKIA